ncbi:MAG: 6-bladed beta-propeller [Balneola sp.]
MKQFLVYLSVLFFLSCSNNQKSEGIPVLQLDPNETEEVNLSSFISEVEYVKLDSGNNKYIGEVEKILVTDDRIYVLDPYQAIALYVYDREGALLFDISNYGRGPGEFMGPYDFDINEATNEIVVYDASSNKLIFYEEENGNFKREEKIEFFPSRFNVLNDGYIFYMNNQTAGKVSQNYNVLIADNELNIIDRKISIEEDLAGFHYSLPVNFTATESEIYLSIPFNNTVYSYKAGTFGGYLTIDFEEENLPNDFLKKDNTPREWLEEFKKITAAYNISNFYENDDYVFFLYSYMDNQNYYLSSKKSDKVVHTNNEKFKDDLNIGPLTRWPSAIWGNTLIWWQNPKNLIEFVDEKKDSMNEAEWLNFTKENEKLISFYSTLSADDNPYLIFTKIEL